MEFLIHVYEEKKSSTILYLQICQNIWVPTRQCMIQKARGGGERGGEGDGEKEKMKEVEEVDEEEEKKEK